MLKNFQWKFQAVDAFREGNQKEVEYLLGEVSNHFLEQELEDII